MYVERGDGRIEKVIEKGTHPSLDKNNLILFLHTKNSDIVKTCIKATLYIKSLQPELYIFDSKQLEPFQTNILDRFLVMVHLCTGK